MVNYAFSDFEVLIISSVTVRSILPSLRARSAWWGGVGGGGCFRIFDASMRARICGATPHPRPLPAATRGEGRNGGAI